MVKRTFLSDLTRRFSRDRRGNVGIMAGFLIVPLAGIVGVTVDYSRASSTRQALNAAIDSASLMAARDAQKLSDSELKTRVDSWISDNLPERVKSEFTGATLTVDRVARTIRIEANANVSTTLSRVIGTNTVAVSSNSQATWGTNKIELALALDNTGSMASSNKMTNLKTAAKSLLKIMKDAALETDQIRVSIVPFNTQVRISRSFKDEQWMRYGMTRNITCDQGMKNCKYKSPVTGTTISVSDTSNFTCDKNGKTCVDTMTKATWASMSQGCVTDRDKNYDTTDGGGFAASAEQYPAFWCSQSSLAEVMPLTSDWTALEGRIDTMTPVGNTNVTIGAIWGWATLTQSAPFSEAKPSTEPRLKKYMILLTDGDNTENRFSSSQTQIDPRTSLACTNAKASGINLYTIRVIDGDAALLKGCASDASMYYDVQNASQLDPVFKAIANEISAVRLTH